MTIKNTSIIKSSLILFVAVLMLVLVPANSLAQEFLVEAESINYKISPDEVASYELEITNLAEEEVRYSLGLALGDLLNWDVYPSSVRVPASSTETITFEVFPKASTPIGVYQLNFQVRSETEKETIPLPVHLSYDGRFYDFIPNVETKINLPDSIDPRESARVMVTLRNRNPLNIENAELRIRSELFNGEQVINITPGPHMSLQDAISKEFFFQLNPLQEPGEYEVSAQVYYPKVDEVISRDTAIVTVVGYSKTPTTLDVERNLFVVKDIITVENFGNKEAVAEVKLGASWIKRLFSQTSHEAEFVKAEGETSFVWILTLEPTEKQTIVVRTNYWPLVIFILLAILALVAYFRFRSPIVLEKEAAIVDEDVGEGSSDIKIRIFVKNRSGDAVKNLTVIDKVRGITDYVESNQLGHVKPSRTTKTSKKGTLLYWDVDEIEPYEERIFTYKLKSKLKVVGELTLPKVSAKFETSTNKERRVLSDVPIFKRIKKKKEKN